MKQTNRQNGSLHLIVLIAICVSIVGTIVIRHQIAANDARKSQQIDTAAYLTSIPSDVLSYEKIRELAFLHHGRSSVSAIMIKKINGLFTYEIRFVDLATVRIDAQSGMIVESNETVSVSRARRPLEASKPRVGFETARKIAVQYRKGAAALAVEYGLRDELLSYGVYFEDDRRVDVDANSGAVVVYQ